MKSIATIETALQTAESLLPTAETLQAQIDDLTNKELDYHRASKLSYITLNIKEVINSLRELQVN